MSCDITCSASATIYTTVCSSDLTLGFIKNRHQANVTARMTKAKGLDESAKSRKSAVDEKKRKAVDNSELYGYCYNNG